MMEKQVEESYRAHIVVLPYHGQGHVNPLLQFSKRLAAKIRIKITVATTLSNTKSMESSSSIRFESIYDDDRVEAGVGGLKGFLDRFEAVGSTNLIKLITKAQHPCVKCLIYDANIPWAFNVAHELGIATASFFTQSCSFITTCYPMYCELMGVSPPSLPPLLMPGLPPIRLPNLPSLGPQTGPYPPIIRYILRQFDNTHKVDWLLFNSFHHLEDEAIKWMSRLWPVRTIGPTLPSLYLDNRVKDDNNYGFNIIKPNTDACLNWLDSKEKDSVIYVSFGSVTTLSCEQTRQVANALLNSTMNFLWVVKPSEESKLPTDFNKENNLDRGLVVNWCPQLVVLAHEAVGCFVSHCGWNSTTKAISLGVPMVAMPQFMDQITNAHFVEHVWHVGIQPKTDDKGFCLSKDIQECIEEIMEGERGREIRKNVTRLKALAKEAIDEGGSSDVCIDEIITKLTTI
ncbi:hypothetical protein ACS0TY_021609 [Phlomoides rotata]